MSAQGLAAHVEKVQFVLLFERLRASSGILLAGWLFYDAIGYRRSRIRETYPVSRKGWCKESINADREGMLRDSIEAVEVFGRGDRMSDHLEDLFKLCAGFMKDLNRAAIVSGRNHLTVDVHEGQFRHDAKRADAVFVRCISEPKTAFKIGVEGIPQRIEGEAVKVGRKADDLDF